MDWMQFIWAFIVGGLICVAGQVMMDKFRLTPAHTMSTLVVVGAIVDGIPAGGGKSLYERFIDFAGAGATVPITSFGNSLVHGTTEALREEGIIGILTGLLEVSSAGISAAIAFSFLAALVFKPQG